MNKCYMAHDPFNCDEYYELLGKEGACLDALQEARQALKDYEATALAKNIQTAAGDPSTGQETPIPGVDYHTLDKFL